MYKIHISIFRNGDYEGIESYDVHIDENTKDEDVLDALMNEAREILNKEFDGDDDWENGYMSWQLNDFEKL